MHGRPVTVGQPGFGHENGAEMQAAQFDPAPCLAAPETGQRLLVGQWLVVGGADDVGLRPTGPMQLPIMLFDNDADFRKGNLFAVTALQHGAYLHPWHNMLLMLLSVAHTEDDIAIALRATKKALEAVARAIPTTGAATTEIGDG